MEQLTETVTLDMEEANELAFKIKVEGANSPAKVRLICESNDVAYMFSGRGTSEEGVVQFVIPQMKDKIEEGTYSARVEVLIENRYFSPVQFQLNFKKPVKVFAESIQVAPAAPKLDVRVTAAPIRIVQAARPEPRPVVVEAPEEKPVIRQVQQPQPIKTIQNDQSGRDKKKSTEALLKEKYTSLKEKFQK